MLHGEPLGSLEPLRSPPHPPHWPSSTQSQPGSLALPNQNPAL